MLIYQRLRIFSFCLFSIYQTTPIAQSDKDASNVSFLYNNRFGKKVRSCITGPWFSTTAGYMADTRLSKRGIRTFIKRYNINIDDIEKPVSKYTSLNDFFSRKLRPGARPIDQHKHSIVSPADGNILVIEHLQATTTFPVKTCTFNLAAFLQDSVLAQNYIDGTLVIIRISPGDYHRFHFPTTCTPSAPCCINGKYESVNALVYQAGVQPLTENERHRIILTLPDTRKIIMVPVGAMCVGKIIETYRPEMSYDKGAEAGYFGFGGSTVVLLFPPHCVSLHKQFVHTSENNIETPLKMGETIGTLVSGQLIS